MPRDISSVKALLQHQDLFLILKEELHKGPIWDLPGGKIEYGESPQEALHREIKEELDLAITIHQSIGVWYFFSQTHHHQIICHTFSCSIKGSPTIDTSKNPADEHFSEIKWASVEEIISSPSIEITDSLRTLLKRFTQ